MRKLYMLFAAFILLGYSWLDWHGYELAPSHRQFVPQGLRAASHGGYRSFWTSGYHGGK